MSTVDHEVFAIGQDQQRSDPVQLATLESVIIYRAKFLDDLIGHALSNKNVTIPSDIDDLEVPDSIILNVLQNDNLTPQQRAKDVVQAMKDRSATNPLNWQNAIKKDYLTNLQSFVSALRKTYIEQSSKVFQGSLTDDDKFNSSIVQQDVTRFCSLGEITCDLEFGNQAPFSISIAGMQEAQQSGQLKFIPRETDVVEIIVRYPDGTLVTEFLGIIYSISYQESYGQNTIIPMMAYGLSKLLMLNKMVVDRGLVSQFEDGDLAQAGVTPWDTNQFANNSVDEIFNFIMINELGMKPVNNPKNIGAEKSSASFEQGIILDTLIPLLQRQATDIENQIGISDTKLTQGIIEDQSMSDDHLPTDGVFIRDHLNDTLLETKNVTGRLNEFITSNKKPSAIHLDQAENLMANLILQSRLQARMQFLQDQIKLLSQVTVDPTELSIDYKFDAQAFNNINTFNLIYIPIMTIAMVRLHQDFVVAKFRGKQSFAFDLAIRGGFRVFFSQMQYPNEILNAVRQTAKHVVYENERNQIIAEIPRYNDFSADDGELLSDFVITNASPIIDRQDLSLKTRQDVKEYIPFVGTSPAESLSSGHFTDPAVLAKYGMRTDDPILNPNATKGLTFSFASIELTNANALTRTITVNPPANHSYKVGRLYFVARKYAENTIGEPSGEVTTNMDGYVGYTARRALMISQGNVVTFNLTMHYVRKSRLVIDPDHLDRFAANFKILPDIGGLIDALETARTAGELSDEDMRQDTPPLPPPENPAKTIPIPNGAVYVTPNITFSNTNLPTGSLIPVGHQRIQANNIMSNPDTILLDGGNEKAFGPVQDSVPYIIDIDEGNVPIAVQSDFDGGISSAMAVTLNMVDLRIRSLNEPLFPKKNITYPAGNVFGLNWRHSILATTFGMSIDDKKKVWRAQYVPTHTMNPDYRIVQLKGWYFYAVQTNTAIPLLPAGVFSQPGGNINSSLAVGNLLSQCSILVGPPIDVTPPDASDGLTPTVVILQFDNEPQNPQRNITIGDIPVHLFNSANLKDPINMPLLQTQLTNAMKDFGLDASDQTLLMNNFIQELNNVPETTTNTLLPVFFVPPPTTTGSFRDNFHEYVLETTDPGVSISMLDIMTYSPVKFPAQIDFSEDGDTSTLHTEHSKGDAVDFTLTPYYAISGYTLAQHTPYILSSDYPNLNGNAQLNRTHLNLAFAKSLLRLDTHPPKHIDTFIVNTSVKNDDTSVKNDDTSRKSIQTIFDTIIEKNGFPFTFNIADKLQPDDQFWYHISAMNPLP